MAKLEKEQQGVLHAPAHRTRCREAALLSMSKDSSNKDCPSHGRGGFAELNESKAQNTPNIAEDSPYMSL